LEEKERSHYENALKFQSLEEKVKEINKKTEENINEIEVK
jgi:hypothetical protein